MMKERLHIIIQLPAAALLSITFLYFSCNKKVLDIPSPTQTENAFFKSEEEFRRAIIGAYARLTDYYSSTSEQSGGSAQLEIWYLPGDDCSQNGSQAFEFFKGLNPSDPKLNQFFKSSYALIARANKVLQKLATVPAGVFTTPHLKEYGEGEMLFLRAFAHFMLWNVFGTAPVDTIVVTGAGQFHLPGSKGVQLLDQSITDLKKAVSLLPAIPWDSTNTGRVTAQAAYALLGKCLVFRSNALRSVADYQAAISAFDQIQGVSLMPDFNKNFDINFENNSESLFEFQAGVNITGDQNNWLGNDDCDCGVAGAYYQMFYEGSASYMANGPYIPTAKLKNSFTAHDPRLMYTLDASKKRFNKYVVNGDVGNNNTSYNNHRILRYADVLLLKAEAALQSGNPAAANSLINQVRMRARNMRPGGTEPADHNLSETNTAVIMQWIMDERLRELAGEGHRWFDLRRWHMAGYISLTNDFFNSEVPVRMGFDAHYLYFPIPDGEMSRNPNIQQNAGY
jgi:hypothetical protein